MDTVHLNTPLRPAQTLDVQESNLISKCKVHDINLCAFMLAVLNDQFKLFFLLQLLLIKSQILQRHYRVSGSIWSENLRLLNVNAGREEFVFIQVFLFCVQIFNGLIMFLVLLFCLYDLSVLLDCFEI